MHLARLSGKILADIFVVALHMLLHLFEQFAITHWFIRNYGATLETDMAGAGNFPNLGDTTYRTLQNPGAVLFFVVISIVKPALKEVALCTY